MNAPEQDDGQDAGREGGVQAWLGRRPTYRVAKQTVQEWIGDRAPELAAAVAFFSIFSLAPVLVLIVVIAGFIFGEGQAREALLSNLRDFAGPQVAETLGGILSAANEPSLGSLAAVFGVLAFLFGATAVFAQLQSALNQIWDVKSEGGVKNFLAKRVTGLATVLLVGVLLMAALVASAALAAVSAAVPFQVPGGVSFWRALNILLSFGLATVLFGLLFQYLPDLHIAWRDVWIGALFTAALFVLGKEVLAYWMSQSGLASVYGAAGSLVVLLLWIYYSTLIFLFGAEFTQVYANTYGTHPVPEAGARRRNRRRRRGAAGNP